MSSVAIVQSNYIPWKGYFDLIAAVDEFVIVDSVQYTRRDWRNRNKIKTARGLKWLTIPVLVKGRYRQTIEETEVADPDWRRSHWDSIVQAYREAPCFEQMAPGLERLYKGAVSRRLSAVNLHFIQGICPLLRIETRLSDSREYAPVGVKTERLVDICVKAGADTYVSGPAARAYLDEELFRREGIQVRWFDYSGYPEYPQLHGEFEQGVSVIDLVLNTGARAPDYMLSGQATGSRA